MAPTLEEQVEQARAADLARQLQGRELERQYESNVRKQQLWHQKQREEDLARQEAQTQSKMGWGIFSAALVLSLIADLVEIFTLGTIGWLVGLFVDLILAAMLGFSKAGRKQWKKWIWGPIIETVPFLDVIPFRTGFLIWSFVASRNEKLQTITSAVSLGSAKQ